MEASRVAWSKKVMQKFKWLFTIKMFLLHRIFTKGDQVIEQMVLTIPCWHQALVIGHSAAFAGHIGVNKTETNLLKQFYGPGFFFHLVQKPFWQSYKAFQIMMPKGKVPRATSWQWWTFVPLQKTETLLIFSRIGFIITILSDRGTVGIWDRRDTWVLCMFLPSSNEWYLWRIQCYSKSYTIQNNSKPPNKLGHIPTCNSFSIREVLQNNSGFLSFELVYGVNPWVPFKIYKEILTSKTLSQQN